MSKPRITGVRWRTPEEVRRMYPKTTEAMLRSAKDLLSPEDIRELFGRAPDERWPSEEP